MRNSALGLAALALVILAGCNSTPTAETAAAGDVPGPHGEKLYRFIDTVYNMVCYENAMSTSIACAPLPPKRLER
jgi:hypothetical protein